MFRVSSVAIGKLGAIPLESHVYVGRLPSKHKRVLLSGVGFRSVVNTLGSNHVSVETRVNLQVYCPAVLRVFYCHIPVESLFPEDPVVDAFAAALNGLPRPIFVLSDDKQLPANLWALARAHDLAEKDICMRCADFDLGEAEVAERIAARRAFIELGPNATIH